MHLQITALLASASTAAAQFGIDYRIPVPTAPPQALKVRQANSSASMLSADCANTWESIVSAAPTTPPGLSSFWSNGSGAISSDACSMTIPESLSSEFVAYMSSGYAFLSSERPVIAQITSKCTELRDIFTSDDATCSTPGTVFWVKGGQTRTEALVTPTFLSPTTTGSPSGSATGTPTGGARGPSGSHNAASGGKHANLRIFFGAAAAGVAGIFAMV